MNKTEKDTPFFLGKLSSFAPRFYIFVLSTVPGAVKRMTLIFLEPYSMGDRYFNRLRCISLLLNIQGGREISAILLTVVGDGCKDTKIYTVGLYTQYGV